MIIDYAILNKIFVLPPLWLREHWERKNRKNKGQKDKRRQGCKMDLRGMTETLQSWSHSICPNQQAFMNWGGAYGNPHLSAELVITDWLWERGVNAFSCVHWQVLQAPIHNSTPAVPETFMIKLSGLKTRQTCVWEGFVGRMGKRLTEWKVDKRT